MGSDICREVDAIVVSIDDHDKKQYLRQELLSLLSSLDLKFETVMNHAKDPRTSKCVSPGPEQSVSLSSERRHHRKMIKTKDLTKNKCIIVVEEDNDDDSSFRSLDSNKVRCTRNRVIRR